MTRGTVQASHEPTSGHSLPRHSATNRWHPCLDFPHFPLATCAHVWKMTGLAAYLLIKKKVQSGWTSSCWHAFGVCPGFATWHSSYLCTSLLVFLCILFGMQVPGVFLNVFLGAYAVTFFVWILCLSQYHFSTFTLCYICMTPKCASLILCLQASCGQPNVGSQEVPCTMKPAWNLFNWRMKGPVVNLLFFLQAHGVKSQI